MITALTAALLAFLIADVLTQPGEILEWWPKVVNRVVLGNVFADYDNETGFKYWIPKLLYACSKCQAFWWFLILYFLPESVINFVFLGCCAVLGGYLLSVLNQKLRN